MRKRKIWSLYGENTNLEVNVYKIIFLMSVVPNLGSMDPLARGPRKAVGGPQDVLRPMGGGTRLKKVGNRCLMCSTN